MKTIKSTLIGAKQISSTQKHDIERELKEIVAMHRDVVINHLLKDVDSYVYYKKGVKLNPTVGAKLKQRLIDLKKNPVDLNKYQTILDAVENRALIPLDNGPFYIEIDELIESEMASKAVG